MAAYVLYRGLGGTAVLRMDRRHPAAAAQNKITELTEYASRLRAQNKYLSTEKVYLQILKIDHKHAPTYNRLGTLYVTMKNLDDALECFQIATQLSPSGATYYNLGLGYYENQNYIKAIAAFEKAIMFEPTAQRYIGLAKAFQKASNLPKTVYALEQAVEIEAKPRTLWLLADAYRENGQEDKIPDIQDQIRNLDPKDARIRSIPSRRPSVAQHS
jgi:tetratricopeptide (TPR) repeat protein